MTDCLVKASNITCPHAFSTRLGGVSEGEFQSLNLGRLDFDDPDKVAENWKIFGAAAGIDTARFVHGHQVHGNTVHIVTRENAHGILEPANLDPADGYVTNAPGVPLAVFTADCAPLLMHEPSARVIAAVHSGWRSTAADIGGEAVKKMEQLGADRKEIRAAIGPCIHKCCFQVGAEVIDAMEALVGGEAEGLYAPDSTEQGKFRLDLPGVIKRRLIQLGLREENIEILDECTMCRPDKYWSHRAMGLHRGSQASIIML